MELTGLNQNDTSASRLMSKKAGEMMHVPFHTPYYTGKEIEMVADALARMELCGDGYYTKKVMSLFEEKYHIEHLIPTTSCTHALEMAMLLIGLQPGDEVIMPSFTFPSTANAVTLRGAKPVFAEIETETLTLDPAGLETLITPRTKAIIPVHYGGIGCKMDQIMDIAARNRLYVVEDAAQGVDALYRERYLGTWGDLGCFSFHSTKNFTSGEGGALVINPVHPDWAERAAVMAQKGTNRRQFLEGRVERYSWVDQGSSYLPSDLLMALLYAQLCESEKITAKRRAIHEYYRSRLQMYEDDGLFRMIRVPGNCRSNYHLFYLIFRDQAGRDRVKDGLKAKGVEAVIHYVPLHSSPRGLSLGYREADLPVTEKVSRTLLRLPISTGLTEAETELVVNRIKQVLEAAECS
jgi:dTDP-4-amino-4,6-dideoxygalactose transaminase